MATLTPAQIKTHVYLASAATKLGDKRPRWSQPAVSKIAVAIAMAESGGRTDARNPSSNARGLFQVIPGTAKEVGRDWNRLDDPSYNAVTAYRVYQLQGWGAWSVYNSGAYLKYMDADTSSPPPPLPGPIGDALDPLQNLGTLATDVGRVGQWLGNPANWLRIVYVVVGGALVIASLAIVAKPVVDPIAKATPVGRIVKIAKGK